MCDCSKFYLYNPLQTHPFLLLATSPKMVATEEHFADASSGPSTHDKNTRKKRMAKVPAIKNTKAKKQKVDKAAEMYERFVKHGKPLRKSQPNEQV